MIVQLWVTLEVRRRSVRVRRNVCGNRKAPGCPSARWRVEASRRHARLAVAQPSLRLCAALRVFVNIRPTG